MTRLNDRTKGYWHVGLIPDKHGDDTFGVVDTDGCNVATVWPRDDAADASKGGAVRRNGPTMAENACLLAAAPQMYEALLAIHDSLMMRDALGSRPAKMLLAALKAVEDVEGRHT